MAIQRQQMEKLVHQLSLAENVSHPTVRDVGFDSEVSLVWVRVSAAEARIKDASLQ